MTLIALTSTLVFFKPDWLLQLTLHPYSIRKGGEYYRILTGDLVHNDWLHLLFNEFMLLMFGASLERYLNSRSAQGSWLFLCIYLASCFCGAVGTLLRHGKDFGFMSAGASGSIMGCMFSYILLQPHVVAYYLPVWGPVQNIYGGLLYILVMIVYQQKRTNTMINQEVHFYGALGGMITTLVIMAGGLK
ncbi:rhomboid family intramembrane serine protease [Mucilaginibacter robiniae]|uniref:Rhomboid family intramembrane serine protease n=1 Tax=Mucilaginibacter robiniae TaxID=2728022 RepID=A0A7L5E0S2_9SPHI|nr:rhomboid family intramembrane serine protease [Mucilaginibacter robiniae]QJD95967.1 rhomboid family intramembrane serine protease [Mucilaginibacter robiniae]